MANRWSVATIGEVADIFDGPHATPPKAESGPVFLGISNLENGRISLTSAEYVSEEWFAKWTRRVEPQPGDLVFSYETRLGEAALIPEGLRCCLGRRMGLLRFDRQKVDPRFMLYAYLGRKFQETLRARTVHGSTVDRLPLSQMGSFPISVPPLAEQRRIAHILGSLDDKIELNRRMNETLEEMARALFKSWFVDFDPVRAKAEGRDPGLPPHIADLFPDRLVDSDLGEIPEGWRQGLLSELVVDLRDSVSPLLTPGEVFEHFSIPAFDDGRQPRIERGASIKSLKLRVSEGAILLSKLNPEIERVWMTDVQLAGRAICSTEFMVLQSPGGFGRAFAYAVMTSAAFRDGIKSRVTGTSGSHQRAGRDGVMQLPVVIPVRDLVASYEMLATPWLDEVSVNQREATALAAIRDALLPRLLCDRRLAMDSSCGPAEG